MAVIDDLVSSGLSGTQATEVIAVGAGTGSDAALVSQGFSTTQATQILAAKEGDATEVELVQQGLFGTQASAIMEAVGSGPAPSTPLTYTRGVDYGVSGGLQVNTMGETSLSTADSDWTNSTGLSTLVAQPSGAAYTFDRSGVTYTFTTTAAWTSGAGTHAVTGNITGGSGPFPGGPPYSLSAVTFTPA